MKKAAFIDLEASGLGPGSWPIEVGWCFTETKPETMLIIPAPDWSKDAWDAQAEALHGISYEMLSKAGRPVIDVCAALNSALAGYRVYSDAPDWDGFWLYRIFQSAGIKQQFSLMDFGEIFAGASELQKRAILEQATAIAPHRHRAHDDVLHMRTVYSLTIANDN